MMLRQLLNRYRSTLAAYEAAHVAHADREESESLSIDESNAANDRLHEDYFEPFYLARGLLLSAVCLEHGMDPRIPVPRPVAVQVDGALIVVARDWNDSGESHVHVVEPADALNLGRA